MKNGAIFKITSRLSHASSVWVRSCVDVRVNQDMYSASVSALARSRTSILDPRSLAAALVSRMHRHRCGLAQTTYRTSILLIIAHSTAARAIRNVGGGLSGSSFGKYETGVVGCGIWISACVNMGADSSVANVAAILAILWFGSIVAGVPNAYATTPNLWKGTSRSFQSVKPFFPLWIVKRFVNLPFFSLFCQQHGFGTLVTVWYI